MYYKGKYPKPTRLPKKVDVLVRHYNGTQFFEYVFLDGSNSRHLDDTDFCILVEQQALCMVQDGFRSMLEYVLYTSDFLLTATQPNKLFLSGFNHFLETCRNDGIEVVLWSEDELKAGCKPKPKTKKVLEQMAYNDMVRQERLILEEVRASISLSVRSQVKEGLVYA